MKIKTFRKHFKNLFLIVLALLTLGSTMVGCSAGKGESPTKPESPESPEFPESPMSPDPEPEDPPAGLTAPPDDIVREGIGALTSMELVRTMKAGWNLGNTLDAHWNARVWGTINVPSDQETLWETLSLRRK